MRLTILGMNGPYPAPGGATSGYLLTCGDVRLGLDLGCGTLARLTALTPPEELSALLLTHWHYDHCSDVLPLIYRLEGLGATLHIYAPVDEASPIRQAVMASKAVVLHDLRPGDTFSLGDAAVEAFAARHPAPALMYRIAGMGRTFCYTGDTNTMPTLTAFAKDADFLLADGLFTDSTWGEGKPHLSATHVAQLAQDANVRRFVITHLNPAIDPDTLLREARAIRRDATLAACGDSYEI